MLHVGACLLIICNYVTICFVLGTSQPLDKKSHTLCPISSRFDTPVDGMFGYPWDIYDPPDADKFKKISSASDDAVQYMTKPDYINEEDMYNCTNVEFRHLRHSCSTKTKCPVLSINVRTAYNATKWPLRNQLQLIELIQRIVHGNRNAGEMTNENDAEEEDRDIEYMEPASRRRQQETATGSVEGDNKPTRILYFGGSVPTGVETEGYCCTGIPGYNAGANKWLDERCKQGKYATFECIKLSKIPFVNYVHDKNRPDYRSSWVHYFGNWLNSTSSIPIEMHKLTVPATTSQSATDAYSGYIRNLQLNKNDIIFVDYSKNDGVVFRGSRNAFLLKYVEGFIRMLLKFSPPDSKPHIVLLEHFPDEYGSPYTKENYMCPNIREPCTRLYENTTDRSKIMKYTEAYRKVAKHYGLLLWSMRDILVSDYAQRNQPFIEYFLNYEKATGERKTAGHIPWHSHLYEADLYASLFKHLAHHLTFHHSKYHPHHAYMEQFEKRSDSSAEFAKNGLPHPLVPEEEDSFLSVCKLEKPYWTDLSIIPQASNTKGSLQYNYSSIPAGSWKYFEDRKYKPGWITEMNDTYPMDVNGKRVLRIPLLNTAVHEWLSVTDRDKRAELLQNSDIVLRLTYMKTYTPSIVSSVLICDKPLAIIEPMWKDKKATFSSAYSEVIPIGRHLYKACSQYFEENQEVAVDILAPGVQYFAVPNAKIKILGVTVCEVDTGGETCAFCS